MEWGLRIDRTPFTRQRKNDDWVEEQEKGM